jgi:hypothetical protein
MIILEELDSAVAYRLYGIASDLEGMDSTMMQVRDETISERFH